MKKFLSCLLTMIFVLVLAGCSAEDTSELISDSMSSVSVSEESESSEEEINSSSEDDTSESSENEYDSSSEEDTIDSESSEETEISEDVEPTEPQTEAIDPEGSYTTKEDVALYIHTYNCLPPNFMTKKEAQALGWPGGSLEPYAPGMCIGGNYFGNYEGLLPEKDGRSYTECDIDTLGADSRGAKRIVFSNDGLIYYTEDHYESFELLYGEE